jgi:MFS family permease
MNATAPIDPRRAARSPIVLLLAAVLFINYVDRGTLAIAAPLIRVDLHIDDAQMGALLAAFFWTYATMQIPVGWLAERFGAHRVLAAGLALWAVATMLMGTVHSFAVLVFLRLLLGLGESAGFPCVSKLLALVVPPKGLGTANGIVSFAYLFGPAVGAYVGVRLMAQFGWRSAFLVFGGLSLLWLLPWARAAKEVQATRLVSESTTVGSPTFGMILKSPALWGTALGLLSANYTFYFMLSWLPSYLVRERGFSTLEMGGIVGGLYLANAVSAMLGGWAADFYVARGGSATVAYKLTMAIAHVGYVICMLCMAMGSQAVAIGAMFVYQVLTGASSPGLYAVSQILAGPRASGRWVGIQNSVGSLAGVIAPWATGVIIQSTGHFTNAFVVAAAVSVLGLVCWLWMVPTLRELNWRKADAVAPALT